MDFTNVDLNLMWEELKTLFGKGETKSKDNSPQPTFEVECSCGKKSVILYDYLETAFFSLDPEWICLTYVGWFCGERSHEQVGYIILSENHNEVIQETSDE